MDDMMMNMLYQVVFDDSPQTHKFTESSSIGNTEFFFIVFVMIVIAILIGRYLSD